MVIRAPNVALDDSRPPAQTRLRRPARIALAICEIEAGLRSLLQLEQFCPELMAQTVSAALGWAGSAGREPGPAQPPPGNGYQRRNIAAAHLGGRPSGGRLVRELLEAQRREIVLLRNQGEISDEVMHRIERDLDLEDARLEILALALASP
jgi:hypothetical protein